MWWVFLPVTSRTWRVIAAAVTNARQNSSASWGSNGGEPSPGVSGGEGRRRRRGTAGPRGRAPPRPAPRRGARRSRRSAGRRPCRRAPRPATSPRTMPTSSTVWWASTSRSPSASHGEVEAAVPAELARACGRRTGSPVDDLGWSRCRRGRARPRWRSPWSTVRPPPCGRAVTGRGAGGCAHRRLSVKAARKRSFSSGVPTVTRRQPSRPGQPNSRARAPTRLEQVVPHLGRPGGRAEQDEVGVRRPASRRAGRRARRRSARAPRR